MIVVCRVIFCQVKQYFHMQHLRRDYNLISGEITKDVCNPAGSGLLDRYMKYISENMLQ